jgi:hypothetical protein
MKLTPWYSSHIKPVRIGLYETRFDRINYGTWINGFSFWNGTKWACSFPTLEHAFKNKTWIIGAIQDKQWRGLTKETK